MLPIHDVFTFSTFSAYNGHDARNTAQNNAPARFVTNPVKSGANSERGNDNPPDSARSRRSSRAIDAGRKHRPTLRGKFMPTKFENNSKIFKENPLMSALLKERVRIKPDRALIESSALDNPLFTFDSPPFRRHSDYANANEMG
ncbi:hypothetical protein [Paraburkholderia sp. GAS334]|uniref:hypothetical protein n=1 Tax=Paraburkholderia sp. GAS334 TaxID=3035131 RepID=UPI003D208464